MRRGQRRIPDPVFGLITVVAIAVFVYVVFIGLPFRGGFEVKAVLRNAPEIQPGSRVRIAGVNVGKVTGTERGKGTLAVIKMKIDKSALPLHEDTTLKVRPRTFLEGGMFVDVHPGTPGKPDLHDGDTIPVSATSNAVLLGHATADLRSATRDNLRYLVHAARESLEGNAPQALHDAQPYIAPAFLGIAQVAEASQGEEQGDLSGAVRSTSKTMAALAGRDEQLADLLTGLNRTTRALGNRRAEVGRSLEELNPLLAEARPVLADLNRLFPSARSFAAEARPGIQAAPATLRLALPFLDQAEGILRPSELPALETQLDPAVRSLARQEPPLATTLSLVTPVMDCLHHSAYPTLTAKINDPPLSTGEPVYRDLIHALPGDASVAQDFDGSGPQVRYHAGFGDRTVSTGLPGLGSPIVGLTSEPLLGSRPRYTGQVPPFRPRAKCADQKAPNLEAETGPAPTTASANRPALLRTLRQLAPKLERRGRR
ncbi:MAG TPA: MlaD family protein [Thermoleophilaceae bacterium]|jgi:virulence factor Mce-like protein